MFVVVGAENEVENKDIVRQDQDHIGDLNKNVEETKERICPLCLLDDSEEMTNDLGVMRQMNNCKDYF